jgi:poly(hydroxyalkanoate) depolymerase family esterase
MFAYLPDELAPSAPLVVALHGCTQSASDYDVETGWAQLADRWRFALLLPEQRPGNNSALCFQWFSKKHARRQKGEAASIAQMVEHLLGQRSLDRDRVFVTGLSAGGAMTAVMLATYPERFAAGATVAGIPFDCASNAFFAGACMNGLGPMRSPAEWAERVKRASQHPGPWPRLSVWHGSKDSVVKLRNAVDLVMQWTALHGIDAEPEETTEVKGHEHRVFRDASGDTPVESYFVKGMGHSVPIDPGPRPDQCGTPGDSMEAMGICSSFYIGRFWGLDSIEADPPGPHGQDGS